MTGTRNPDFRPTGSDEEVPAREVRTIQPFQSFGSVQEAVRPDGIDKDFTAQFLKIRNPDGALVEDYEVVRRDPPEGVPSLAEMAEEARLAEAERVAAEQAPAPPVPPIPAPATTTDGPDAPDPG